MPTYRNDTQENQQAENINGQMVMVAPGETIETYQVLPGPDWTKTADTPYFNIASAEHKLSAAEAGWLSQDVDVGAAAFDIYATVEITIHANSQSAGGYRLLAGQSVQIANDRNIDTLHIYATAAGTVIINELEG